MKKIKMLKVKLFQTKGGVIVEHLDTKSLMFCPGSQIILNL